MSLTKDELINRRNEYINLHTQSLANSQRALGGIDECNFHIQRIEEAEKKAADEAAKAQDVKQPGNQPAPGATKPRAKK